MGDSRDPQNYGKKAYTDVVSRLEIQYFFGYPVFTMGSHVSAVPNHQTGRQTKMSARACVAMSGTLGYELDITKMSDEEKQEVRQQIESFHQFYNLIQYGDYYRLTGGGEFSTVWEFADPNGEEALVNAVFRRVEANPAPVNICGLRDENLYLVELVHSDEVPKGTDQWLRQRNILSGVALKYGGLTIPFAWKEYQAFQIHIKCCTK